MLPAVEQIARRHDGRVIRTKANPTALMEECRRDANVVLGGSGEMAFRSCIRGLMPCSVLLS